MAFSVNIIPWYFLPFIFSLIKKFMKKQNKILNNKGKKGKLE
jgi:hypothetical protein